MQKMHMYFSLFRLLVIRNNNHKEFTNTILPSLFQVQKNVSRPTREDSKSKHPVSPGFSPFHSKKTGKKPAHPGQNGRGPSFDQHCM